MFTQKMKAMLSLQQENAYLINMTTNAVTFVHVLLYLSDMYFLVSSIYMV